MSLRRSSPKRPMTAWAPGAPAVLAVALAFTLWWSGGSLCAAAALDDSQRMDESAALTDWLARAGLDDLLAVTLDEQVRKSTASNPAAIARLADAYLRLANSAADEDRIADLRIRIEKFLRGSGVPDPGRLMLALGRADYRMALRGIERIRQGWIDNATRARTEASLLQSLKSLDQLADRLTASIAENQLRIGGVEEQQRIALLAARDDDVMLLLSAKFLRAWCRYWLLWIDRPAIATRLSPPAAWSARARALVTEWSELLETGKAFPEPGDCSVDLISQEYYAQSILAMALTRALDGEMQIAERWFALLEQPGVWDGLVNSSPWYLHALVDAGSYSQAEALLGDPTKSIGSTAVVGAAIRAVKESPLDPHAIACARLAVTRAAVEGDFSSVRRLAREAPALLVGDDFAACLARGIESYDRGRSESDSALKRASLASAALDLSLALTTAPADRQTGVAVQELLAWAQLGAGQPCDAAASFLSAANQLVGGRADEALWMAVQSAATGNCPDEAGNKGAWGLELARHYLARHEVGNHAVGAAAMLARVPDAHNDDALVDRLIREAARGGDSVAARASAGLLLYRRFRGAEGSERAIEAGRLLALPPLDASFWPRGGIDLVIRQQLEAALDPVVGRVDDARAILKVIAAKYPIGQEPIELRSELGVRRLCVALALHDPAIALEAIGAVRAIADAQWRPVAEGLFIRSMESSLASGKQTPAESVPAYLGLVLARRAVRESARESGDPQLAEAANRALGRALVRGAAALRKSGLSAANLPSGADPQTMAKEALAIARELLAQRPDDADAVGLLADAGIAMGDSATAYEALTRLVAALPMRSDAWFERKADLCELMIASQPDEVRKILTQHAVLIPEWGPGEGGKRLKDLAMRLGVNAPPGAPAGEKSK